MCPILSHKEIVIESLCFDRKSICTLTAWPDMPLSWYTGYTLSRPYTLPNNSTWGLKSFPHKMPPPLTNIPLFPYADKKSFSFYPQSSHLVTGINFQYLWSGPSRKSCAALYNSVTLRNTSTQKGNSSPQGFPLGSSAPQMKTSSPLVNTTSS